ncbi:MAG TPA: radical SAM family heme chaperone HemW, partial [Acidimicrobiales bacterium]
MDFGVYVHIPVCARRCDYCAFATWTDRAHLMGDYTAACITELHTAQLPAATSVFFGGGTPSLLPAPLLLRVLDAVERAPGAEVTVECNPDTVSLELLAEYRAGGVTRVSFGVQSMAPHVLAGLGRTHDPGAVMTAAAAAVAVGFDSWNVDLIFGGFGERDLDWQATLDAVCGLGVPHVSAYALTVEPGTALAEDVARHPDDDVQAGRYLMAESALSAAGLHNYEISNWARPGHECRHNLLYWRQGEYRGIGCAAHSHVGGRRWWNVRTAERYIDLINAGRSPEGASSSLGAEEREREGLELSLRTRAGVPLWALPDWRSLEGLGL